MIRLIASDIDGTLLPYDETVMPHGTVIRQNFETMYKNKKKNTSAENVQLQVDKGMMQPL